MSTPFEDVQELVRKARALVDEIHQTVGPCVLGGETNTFAQDAKLYIVLSEFKDLGAEMSKAFNLIEDGLSTRIADKMNSQELETGQVEVNGARYNFTPDKKMYVSCKKEEQPTLIAWLKQHPSGAGLVKESVHDKTLQKFIIEEVVGAGEMPPKFISMHLKSTLSVRKAPTKA